MLCCSLQFCNSTFKKRNPTSHIKLWFLKPKRILKFYEKSAGSLKHGNGLFPCILKAINWQVFSVHREVSNKKQNKIKKHNAMMKKKKCHNYVTFPYATCLYISCACISCACLCILLHAYSFLCYMPYAFLKHSHL